MKKPQGSKYGNYSHREVVDDKKFRVAVHPKTNKATVLEGAISGLRPRPAVTQYVDTVTTQGRSHIEVALIADALLW